MAAHPRRILPHRLRRAAAGRHRAGAVWRDRRARAAARATVPGAASASAARDGAKAAAGQGRDGSGTRDRWTDQAIRRDRGARGGRSQPRARRDTRPHRAQRVGQDDSGELRRRSLSRRCRNHPISRRADRRAAAPGDRAARRRAQLPERQPRRRHDGARRRGDGALRRQRRRLAAPRAGDPRTRSRARRGARRSDALPDPARRRGGCDAALRQPLHRGRKTGRDRASPRHGARRPAARRAGFGA